MPREPIQLTDHQRGEVETLAALLSQEQIADYLGIARNTFRAICERDPDIAARYKRGKAKAIAHVANGLLQKARSGDTTSMIFFLKTQAGWRETNRFEHSGPDGAPIETKSARERLSEMLDRIAGPAGSAASAVAALPAAACETVTIEARTAGAGDGDGDAG